MTGERDVRDAADARWSIRDERAAVARDLLGDDRDHRRRALRTARQRRWIESFGDVVVRIVVAETTSTPAFDELVRALASSGRDHSLVLDAPGGAGVAIVTTERRTRTPIEDWIRSAAPTGVRIAAIGSASLLPEDDDLLRPVDEARTAAEIVEQIGQDALGSHRAEDLGGWRLLHAIAGDPALVSSASPAAEELWRSDSVRLQTVETYLDAGCNVARACEQLHIHRTTLYYRLDTMPQLVRDALADGLQRSTLHLSLKLLRLWNGRTPNVVQVRTLHPRSA